MKSPTICQECKSKFLSYFSLTKFWEQWKLILFVYRESFIDEEAFPEKELAASVVSKVFYYLEEYEEALRLALQAGSKFDLSERSQYVETLIHKCIDQYIEKRV